MAHKPKAKGRTVSNTEHVTCEPIVVREYPPGTTNAQMEADDIVPISIGLRGADGVYRPSDVDTRKQGLHRHGTKKT